MSVAEHITAPTIETLCLNARVSPRSCLALESFTRICSAILHDCGVSTVRVSHLQAIAYALIGFLHRLGRESKRQADISRRSQVNVFDMLKALSLTAPQLSTNLLDPCHEAQRTHFSLCWRVGNRLPLLSPYTRSSLCRLPPAVASHLSDAETESEEEEQPDEVVTEKNAESLGSRICSFFKRSCRDLATPSTGAVRGRRSELRLQKWRFVRDERWDTEPSSAPAQASKQSAPGDDPSSSPASPLVAEPYDAGQEPKDEAVEVDSAEEPQNAKPINVNVPLIIPSQLQAEGEAEPAVAVASLSHLPVFPPVYRAIQPLQRLNASPVTQRPSDTGVSPRTDEEEDQATNIPKRKKRPALVYDLATQEKILGDTLHVQLLLPKIMSGLPDVQTIEDIQKHCMLKRRSVSRDALQLGPMFATHEAQDGETSPVS